jgi:pimeloyl-ACP methyl ester carboxylesterase
MIVMADEFSIIYSSAESVEEEQVTMGDGAKVVLYTFKPPKAIMEKAKEPLLFIPGFIGTTKQWSQVINHLVRNGFLVYSFESREKSSSIANTEAERFSTEGLLKDLAEIIEYLKLPEIFTIIGVSLGSAMAMAHVLRCEDQKKIPSTLVLIKAVYSSEPLRRLINLANKSKVLFKIVIKLVTWFAPIFFWKERRKDPFSYKLTVENLRNADLEKLRKGLICSVELNLKNKFQTITQPSLVLATATDRLHPIEQSQKIAKGLKNGRIIEMENNEELYSEQTAVYIESFLDEETSIPHPYEA